MARITTTAVKDMKKAGKKITMLTAYDFSTAALVDEAGTDMILVGDSLGNVILGYDTTLPVTMDDMIHHAKAVTRAAKNCMVVGDMPFLSYHISIAEAVRNAGRFLQEAGCQAIKLEGGAERVPVIKAIIDAAIPVMGHIGLTPQSVNQMGGFKVQGKDLDTAQRMLNDAHALEEAGCFAIVLECVPAALAQRISEEISIPTIGIGAGPGCDGQVLVINDMLGMYPKMSPKFVKKYVDLHPLITEAIRSYNQEVEAGTFPGPEHCFGINEELLQKLY
ncbi:MAG: 3-methyl-2-oxobutanoate hydroxymethyltransferase [Methylocystaceae bacterium]